MLQEQASLEQETFSLSFAPTFNNGDGQVPEPEDEADEADEEPPDELAGLEAGAGQPAPRWEPLTEHRLLETIRERYPGIQNLTIQL